MTAGSCLVCCCPNPASSSVRYSAANLVKLTVYLGDIEKLAVARARDEFPQTVNPPAAPAVTLVEVSSLVDAELLIEIGRSRLYQSGSVRL